MFTYDEQGWVIELTSGQKAYQFSNHAYYINNDYKYEYRPPQTDQSLLRDTLEKRNIF